MEGAVTLVDVDKMVVEDVVVVAELVVVVLLVTIEDPVVLVTDG
jgi:hypothetical protein